MQEMYKEIMNSNQVLINLIFVIIKSKNLN